MPNCIKLRINTGDKSALVTQDKAIADAYRNKFIIPLDFEMLESVMPYSKWDSETDYVMKLQPTITTKSSIHRKPMPHTKLHTYPWNMKLLLNPTLRDIFQTNTRVWSCCMTELSDKHKL